MKEIWKIRGENAEFKEKFQAIVNDPEIKMSKSIIKYLIRQGIDTPSAINKFINFSEKDIPSVHLLKDADIFLDKLKNAIEEKKNIVVYGDYDMDGVGATATMMRGLKLLGAEPKFFINNRFNEGYGINPAGMQRLLELYPETEFIMTCDNGIKAIEGVQYAIDKGIEVIVSDHHEPNQDGSLPNASAVVDAKRLDDTYPFKDLCGAGLAYKLIRELFILMGKDTTEFDKSLAYVAMSTIGDLVSLTEENRYYVKNGLERLKNEELICFKALREQTGTKVIDEMTVGFTYAPLVNALGRISGDASDAVRMLLAEDYVEAAEYAQNLISMNEERKTLTEEQGSKAFFNIDINQKQERPFIMIWGEFHEGIAGILASRIVEKYHKPTIVLCKTHLGTYKGSGRSVEGFNLKAALDEIADDLIGYGGHEMAAGVTVAEENLFKVENELMEMAKDFELSLPSESILYVDIPVKAEEIDMKFVNEYEELKPYGMGLPKPTVGLINFDATHTNHMGADGRHLKLVNDNGLSVLWFNGDETYQQMGSPKQIKCIGYPQKNIFAGKTSIQFIVEKGRLLPR